MAETPKRRSDRRDRAQIFHQSVADTVSSIAAGPSGHLIKYSASASILLANCYFLLSDCYKKRRLMQDSLTHRYKVAAFTTASIMAVRPIRLAFTTNVVQLGHVHANQESAMRAVEALLGFDRSTLDPDFVRRLYGAVFELIELPCLSNYMADFDNHFGQTAKCDFEQVEKLMPFDNYSASLSTYELRLIEMLINQYATLEKAHGNIYSRILSRFR